jgi:hypothetical protein
MASLHFFFFSFILRIINSELFQIYQIKIQHRLIEKSEKKENYSVCAVNFEG